VEPLIIAGAGHFTTGDGYGPWPAMLAWCLGESSWVSTG
jgi:uncharacterized protein